MRGFEVSIQQERLLSASEESRFRNLKDGPLDFELKPEDNAVVRAFKESKTYMWFREPIDWDNFEKMKK